MWFFMNTCYISSLLTFIVLIIGFLQSIFHFKVFEANHVTFTILASMIYLFTETLIIFFFVGTGTSVKEFTQEKKLKLDYYKTSLNIKRRIYPPQLLNILFMMILFILVGAVDTQRVPAWGYHVYYVFCLAHFLHVKKIQHFGFRENTFNILAMSGVPAPR